VETGIDRRELLATGVGCALGGTVDAQEQDAAPAELFPRRDDEVFLNAAAGTPLSSFARGGLRRFEEFWEAGRGSTDPDRWAVVRELTDGSRARFARLIGAEAGEIALVSCTKAGEQIVLDGLGLAGPAPRGNLVTNDLHFSGSLHNLLGLAQRGLDVRVVQGDGRRVEAADMIAAMDDDTVLVSVTLVSNVNGHVEPLRELADAAHARGALVYADVIQAAGIVPFDVGALGIDFAACSAYKWLYGTYGTGFLYVREDLQGDALRDRMFPGYARHDYTPWVTAPVSDDDFLLHPREDARRYEPGHVGYLGYCAVHESLRFLEEYGVERALAHSVRLNARLLERVDQERYPSLSPHPEASPIVALATSESREALAEKLAAERVVVSLAPGRIRVSPGLYNDDADIDRLVDVLHAV